MNFNFNKYKNDPPQIYYSSYFEIVKFPSENPSSNFLTNFKSNTWNAYGLTDPDWESFLFQVVLSGNSPAKSG